MRLKTGTVSLLCTAALLGTSTLAFAGAYGEEETTVETPAAPAAPAAVVQTAPPKDVEYGMGPYIGVGFALGLDSFTPGPQITDERSSNGYNVRAGWRFHKMLAVEALFEHYLEWDFDPFGHFDAWTGTVNVKGVYGTYALQPFLVAGAGIMQGKRSNRDEKGKSIDPLANASGDTDHEAVVRFGVGADFYLTEMIAFNIEGAYNIPFGDLEDYDFFGLTAGLGLHF